jgi:hypothetical protein
MDPHQIERQDPDPHPDTHQRDKLDPDPHPHLHQISWIRVWIRIKLQIASQNVWKMSLF